MDRWLDRSLLGYTKLGFALRSHPPISVDLHGRNALITGATSGLGLETAKALARMGASVCLVGRNLDKTQRVVREVEKSTGSQSVDYRIADLSVMSDVRSLAASIDTPLHLLVNNAGVLCNERQKTVEGHEVAFATNLLGHFLLTELLLDRLLDSAPARVINVSSGGMYTQKLDLDALLSTTGKYNGAVVYARTKRAQVVLTELWAERLKNTNVVVHSMHPGWADTPGVETSLPLFHKLTKPLLRDAAQGADTIVWLCASEQAAEQTGLFWHDRQPRPTHRKRSTVETAEERSLLVPALKRQSGLDAS